MIQTSIDEAEVLAAKVFKVVVIGCTLFMLAVVIFVLN
jgi:hypothetical protein